MQIGHQYNVSYQGQSLSPKGIAQPSVTKPQPVDPTSVRIKTDALNSTPKQAASYQDYQAHQPNQPSPNVPEDFNFAVAANSGVKGQTVYDKPSGANRLAIDSYRQVENGPKREEIQRLVGIDTFA